MPVQTRTVSAMCGVALTKVTEKRDERSARRHKGHRIRREGVWTDLRKEVPRRGGGSKKDKTPGGGRSRTPVSAFSKGPAPPRKKRDVPLSQHRQEESHARSCHARRW